MPYTDPYKKFKKLVERLKSQTDLTDAQIAAIAGTNPGNFSNYVNGNKIPLPKTLNKLNEPLEKALDEIKEKKLADRPIVSSDSISNIRSPSEEYIVRLAAQSEDIVILKNKLSRLEEEVKAIRSLLEDKREN